MNKDLIQPAATMAAALLRRTTEGLTSNEIEHVFTITYRALEAACAEIEKSEPPSL